MDCRGGKHAAAGPNILRHFRSVRAAWRARIETPLLAAQRHRRRGASSRRRWPRVAALSTHRRCNFAGLRVEDARCAIEQTSAGQASKMGYGAGWGGVERLRCVILEDARCTVVVW
ncbi:hypothetical protein KCP78_24450 [Salmonella enterica subsp. enterica]|nr:hypothetical protein KCP78_24450 [Salmonella enterica subsp. enterica]